MIPHPSDPDAFILSEWDLRRLYNEGDIRRLASEDTYNIMVKYGKPKGATRRIPVGSKSVKTRYFDKITGTQIASFHHYESPERKRIGRFDPKFLRIGEVNYHCRGVGTPMPPRIGNRAINRILGKKGWRARLTYIYHCSEQSRKLWKEKVRDNLVKLGILETREWVLV